MADSFKWPVPDSPPDEGTFHVCSFNEDWLPVVISALNELMNTQLWNSPPDDIQAQVATLIDLILTSLD